MNRPNMCLTLRRSHPGAVLAVIFMAVSALVRLLYYTRLAPLTGWDVAVHLLLPVSANLIFLAGMLTGGKRVIPCSVTAVLLGVTFFLLKAADFEPLHRSLCTLLYFTVLILYTLTVTGVIPTKKLLYPLFALPLLYHIFVEDMKLYVFANPPVPFVHWLPEISVLCIMAALLSQAFAFETKPL